MWIFWSYWNIKKYYKYIFFIIGKVLRNYLKLQLDFVFLARCVDLFVIIFIFISSSATKSDSLEQFCADFPYILYEIMSLKHLYDFIKWPITFTVKGLSELLRSFTLVPFSLDHDVVQNGVHTAWFHGKRDSTS